jgi:thiol-disulfide isomerase/thioredoxin
VKGIGIDDRWVWGAEERRRRGSQASGWRWAAMLALVVMAGLMLAACVPAPRELGGSVPAGTGSSAGADLPSAPRPGHPAPDFALVDIDGKIVKLSDLRGKPVLINFWTTWCPPCRAEMPDIETVYQRHKAEGLVVLGVDVQEERDTVSGYLQKGGFTWTFLLDQTGDTFFGKYRGAAFPSSFFVDRDGVVQDVSIGALNEKGLETKLAKVLPNSTQSAQ